jgi:hypothetical protein
MPRWVRIALTISSILAIAPTIAMMLGQNFLPSEEWVSSVKRYTNLAGLISAGGLTWLMIIGAKQNPRATSNLGKSVVLIFSSILGWFFWRFRDHHERSDGDRDRGGLGHRDVLCDRRPQAQC